MTFPDMPKVLRDFLQVQLGEDLPVRTRVPSPRPAAFIRVWRTGGAARNRVLDEPLMTVESWAEDDTTAALNADRAREAILDHVSEIPYVRGIDFRAGPYDDPDPVSDSPRSTFTFELRVRRARSH